MLGADIAKGVLAEMRINFAKVFLVQKGAAVMRQQLEMPILDVSPQLISKNTCYLAVCIQRILVDIYFPTDATCIGAPRCGTLEFIVEIGFSKNHRPITSQP